MKRQRVKTNARSSQAKWLVCLLVSLWILQVAAKPNTFSRRILRITGNIASKSNRANMSDLITRGAASGYNVVAWDGPPTRLEALSGASVQDGIREIKSKASSLGLPFIPMSLGQGEPTSNDMTHSEAFPVLGTKFVVQGGEAKAVADTALGLVNGGFEDHNGVAPAKWGMLTMVPGKHVFMDLVEKRPGSSGKASLRIENPEYRSMKLRQNVALKPWRAYRLTVWIKTQSISKSRDIGFEVRAGARSLLNNRYRRGVSGNQGWKLHEFDFNSLESKFAQVFLVATDKWTGTGKVWFDDAAIEEVGLYECVRRSSLPIVVKSEDGVVYKDGKDYTITVAAKTTHYDQGKLLIPSGSSINEGQSLRIDWYQLANVRTHIPGASYCHKEAWDVVESVARKTMDALGQPKGWIMKIHSEWSLAYWDPKCKKEYPNAGAYMGATVTNHTELLRQITGNAYIEPYLWSDMTDAYHHGESSSYYFVNGSPRASWLTLDPQSVIINWNEGHKYESMRFFAGMDPKYPNVFFRQLCSFWSGSGTSGWLEGLDKLEGEGMKAGSVVGMMYTTWHADTDGGYTKIEAFANEAKEAGRWGNGPYDPKPVGIIAKRDLGTTRSIGGLQVRGREIEFRLLQNTRAHLDLLNSQGQTIGSLANGVQAAGRHTIRLENHDVAAGIYFVNLRISAGKAKTNLLKKIAVF